MNIIHPLPFLRKASPSYGPLAERGGSDIDDEDGVRSPTSSDKRQKSDMSPRTALNPYIVYFFACVLITLLLMVVVLLVVSVNNQQPSATWETGFDTDYIGIRKAIRLHQKEFSGSRLRPNHNRTGWDLYFPPGEPHFVGEPSPSIDDAWNELLSAVAFNRSGAGALPIADKTHGFPDGNYVMGVAVFHALHCLDIIRLNLNPEVYHMPVPKTQWQSHIYHCVDYLRQYVQCNADLAPTYYHDLGDAGLVLDPHNVHTCRDFDQLHRWIKDIQKGG